MEQTLEGPETLGPTTAGFPSLFRDARVPTQATVRKERGSQVYVSGRQPPTTKEAAGWRVELFPGPTHMAGVGPLLDSQLHPAPS